MRTTRNPRRRRSAFTLVELLVVIGLLLTIVTVGFVGLSTPGGTGHDFCRQPAAIVAAQEPLAGQAG